MCMPGCTGWWGAFRVTEVTNETTLEKEVFNIVLKPSLDYEVISGSGV